MDFISVKGISFSFRFLSFFLDLAIDDIEFSKLPNFDFLFGGDFESGSMMGLFSFPDGSGFGT